MIENRDTMLGRKVNSFGLSSHTELPGFGSDLEAAA
jgi:hypothetical protein